MIKKSEKSRRVARHGDVQFGNDKMQIKETDQAVDLPVYLHLSEGQTVERSRRSETAKNCWKQRGIKRRREKRKKESLMRNARRDAGRADRPW